LKNTFNKITSLLVKSGYSLPKYIHTLPSSGSERQYFRAELENGTIPTILIAYNPDIRENKAWLTFSRHFRKNGFHVPEILAHDETFCYFLMEDLGDTTLFSLVAKGMNEQVIHLYKNAISDLVKFQVEGIKGLDLEAAYPVKSFNRKSVMWDMNYFKYYFVKPNNILFDENRLEDDFERFADHLLHAETGYFMYRDFQSRNIMVHSKEPWYIDFQGGREGPLQYDLASLLYQARAQLPEDLRSDLKSWYLTELEKILPGKTESFNSFFYSFVYFRLMQVLGAYGFRGQLQRKAHFLISIGYAVESLVELMGKAPLGVEMPELISVFTRIIEAHRVKLQQTGQRKNKLTVRINSFSFIKSGIPEDPSLNGGGFVFDCRALPNPGRIETLRDFSGLEEPVINYLKEKQEIEEFLQHVCSLVDQSVTNYTERGFEHLQVNFGCTGGKHRSVYCAEKLAEHLKNYGNKVSIIVHHLMEDNW
jgi:aminoglycoside/choline kinase family phosphotransferase